MKKLMLNKLYLAIAYFSALILFGGCSTKCEHIPSPWTIYDSSWGEKLSQGEADSGPTEEEQLAGTGALAPVPEEVARGEPISKSTEDGAGGESVSKSAEDGAGGESISKSAEDGAGGDSIFRSAEDGAGGEAISKFTKDVSGGDSIFKSPEGGDVVEAIKSSALSTIYFNFDSYTLGKNARDKLVDTANFLSENKQIKIQIAGHCDERGSAVYNLALGERRARSAFVYLTDLGISPNRLTWVSFGEERPVDKAHNEEAWALNRRAEFVPLK